MRKKIRPTKKIQASKATKPTIIETEPLHIGFPITLHHKAENKLCFFRDEIHMKKYVDRCNLSSKDYKITRTAERKS